MAAQVHNKLPEFFKDALIDKLKITRERFPSKKPAAFLDFDGSLIEGDITEGKRTGENTYNGLLDLAIMSGHIPGYKGDEGLKSFWQKYEQEFLSPEEAYVWAAKLVANLEDKEDRLLRDFVARHLCQIVDKYLFSFAHDLLAFCRDEGIIPIVVSASPHYFVQELKSCLPLASEDLFGLNGRLQNGVFVDPNRHDAKGKEDRVRTLCEQRPIYPILAMGNKWRWDGLMIRKACEEGGIGLLVNEGGPSNYTHPSLFYFRIS